MYSPSQSANLLNIASQLLPFQEQNLRNHKLQYCSASLNSELGSISPASVSSNDDDFNIEQVVIKGLVGNRQLPYRNYDCEMCGARGHTIHHCPMRNGKTSSHLLGNSVGVLNSKFGAGSSTSSSSNDNDLDIEQALFKELLALRQVPYRNYVCHRCGREGHMIRYCPTRDLEMPSPYQGERRSIGIFHCTTCNREWQSKNTFANRSHKCNTCGNSIFPSKMYPLCHQY